MTNQHSIGEAVIYKTGVVCRITGVIDRDFSGAVRQYYLLESIPDGRSLYYVPLDSDVALRPVLTADEVRAVISSVSDEADWPENLKERAAAYAAVLESGDRAAILRVIRAVDSHRAALAGTKKKMYASDERVYAAAMRMLCDEFSFVLGVTKDEAAALLSSGARA